MKRLLKNCLIIIMPIGLFTSCGDINKKVEEQLYQLEQKTNQLDSIVNKEVDKVMALDTLINFENKKIQKLDSLINKSSTKLDSIINKKTKQIENIIN